MRSRTFFVAVRVAALSTLMVVSTAFATDTRAPAPEPGPEDGGLRLRLVIEPEQVTRKEGFDVRIELINVSKKPITLRTDWDALRTGRGQEQSGDVKKYLEAATSIESEPAFEPWKGGLPAVVGAPTPKQSEETLKPGETLSTKWTATDRRLKNNVSDPLIVQNPTFVLPGLYSVHAAIDVITAGGTVRLRSNEQLVPIGGSHAMPKCTYGRFINVNVEKQKAVFGLGSLDKIEVGDQFEISSKVALWRFTVTEVALRFSEGKLELVSGNEFGPNPEPPHEGTAATLVLK